MAQEGTTKSSQSRQSKIRGKVLMSWSVPNNTLGALSPAGISVAFVAMVGAIVYAVITREWLNGAVFLVLIFVFLWYIVSDRLAIDVAVTMHGIQIEKKWYAFDNMKGYWVSEKDKVMYLVPTLRIGIPIAVPLGATSAQTVIKSLPKSIEKIEREGADITDTLSRLFRK